MEVGIVRPVSIEDEMRGAYLDYAMSVITSRALPDVRDGLKPVQRRILYAMDELSLHPTSPYKKSARIVGEVLGKYHPHGDAPVYESMVRMAQLFSMRYPLVDGQGNFGSVDGDPPAAMRYTEARLAAIAEEMLADIDKDTVDFQPNFDDSLREPTVLPARLPNLLLNGSSGIAVGMATNIPPHNLGEIADAIVHLISRLSVPIDKGLPFDLVWARVMNAPLDPDRLAETYRSLPPALRKELAPGGRRATGASPDALMSLIDQMIEVPPDDLLAIVKGPDFPTAGIIVGEEGIKSAYTTGRGRIILRARAHFEDARGGRTQIIVTELPYQVNKASLVEKIADLIRERRIEGISDLRDESDRQGMRIVIELRKDVQARQILNQLLKYTSMQTAFSVNMLALVDGQPRMLTLKSSLLHYINYRWSVIHRRTRFELDKARQRAHILEGLKIALDNLDEVIATIRRSRDADTARNALMKKFELSEIQAQAILDMQLRRLAALERQKILDELAATLKLIARLEDLLAHPGKILYLVRDEVLVLKQKYGDARRTQIAADEKVDFSEEDLVLAQEVVVGITARGYVKRMPADSFRLAQRGRGANGGSSSEDDPFTHLALANTRGALVLITNRGRAFQVKVNDLPEAGRQARGLPLNNFTGIDPQERVIGTLDPSSSRQYCVLVTRLGDVKRVVASDYASARSNGLIAMAVSESDEVIWAGETTGEDEVIIASAQGQAIRFPESLIRPSGRTSGGVRGIRLDDKDTVVGADSTRSGSELVIVTAKGYAKRTPLHEFSVQGRGGGGVRAIKVTPRTGPVVSARVVNKGDELYFATTRTATRSFAEAVPQQSRVTQGTQLLALNASDSVITLACLPSPTAGEPNGSKPKGEAKESKRKAKQAKAEQLALAEPGDAKPSKSRAAKLKDKPTRAEKAKQQTTEAATPTAQAKPARTRKPRAN